MKTETMHMTPHEKLRHYVIGAIERGEGEPIVEKRESHATGPWRISFGRIKAGRETICLFPPRDNNANANLIAAAPEMLQALQCVVDLLGDQEGIFIDQCKAAISKAKGEA